MVVILPQMDTPQPSKEEITGDASLLSLQYTEKTATVGQNICINYVTCITVMYVLQRWHAENILQVWWSIWKNSSHVSEEVRSNSHYNAQDKMKYWKVTEDTQTSEHEFNKWYHINITDTDISKHITKHNNYFICVLKLKSDKNADVGLYNHTYLH